MTIYKTNIEWESLKYVLYCYYQQPVTFMERLLACKYTHPSQNANKWKQMPLGSMTEWAGRGLLLYLSLVLLFFLIMVIKVICVYYFWQIYLKKETANQNSNGNSQI